MVIPSGILSDRIGEAPLIKTGLFLTFISAVLLLVFDNPVFTFTIRLIEGFGAGFFVASALSLINSSPDHERMSGYFMALLNVGLVAGLIGTGWMLTCQGCVERHNHIRPCRGSLWPAFHAQKSGMM